MPFYLSSSHLKPCVSGIEFILHAPGMNKLSVFIHGARSFKWSLSLCQWMFSLTFQLTLCEGYREVLERAAVHARLGSRTAELQQPSVTRSWECPGLCWEIHLCLTLTRQHLGFHRYLPQALHGCRGIWHQRRALLSSPQIAAWVEDF